MKEVLTIVPFFEVPQVNFRRNEIQDRRRSNRRIKRKRERGTTNHKRCKCGHPQTLEIESILKKKKKKWRKASKIIVIEIEIYYLVEKFIYDYLKTAQTWTSSDAQTTWDLIDFEEVYSEHFFCRIYFRGFLC